MAEAVRFETGETAADRVTADIHLLAGFEIADRDGSPAQAVGIHAVFGDDAAARRRIC